MNKSQRTTVIVISIVLLIVVIVFLVKACGGNQSLYENEIRKAAKDCNVNQTEMDNIVKVAISEGKCDCKAIETAISKTRKCSGKLSDLPKCSCQQNLSPLDIALFIETSGSTRGYFQQNSNFLKVMLNVPVSIAGQKWNFEPYWIDNEHRKINDYVNDLTAYNQKAGDSNLDVLIGKAIDFAIENKKVSVLVSDYILSPSNGTTLDNLQGKIALKVAQLGSSDFGVFVVRFKSKFKGNYYFEKNRALGFKFIDQNRPYYIWFFGKSEDLTRIRKELALESSPGYEKSIIFLNNQSNQNPYAAVLASSGKSKKSSFTVKQSRPNTLDKINFKSGDPLKFSVAVNLNNLPTDDAYKLLPESFILQSEDNNQCKITEIKTVDKFKSSEKLKNKDAQIVKEASHVITIELKNMIDDNDKLTLGLKKEIPNEQDDWIAKFSTDDDTDITGSAAEKTYGLKFLINALTEGFYPNRNKIKPTYMNLIFELNK